MVPTTMFPRRGRSSHRSTTDAPAAREHTSRTVSALALEHKNYWEQRHKNLIQASQGTSTYSIKFVDEFVKYCANESDSPYAGGSPPTTQKC